MADFTEKPRNLDFKWRTELDYMLPSEMIEFNKLRTAGLISFFRVELCAFKGCDKEIIKGKVYCSIAHKEQAALTPIVDALQAVKQAVDQAADDVLKKHGVKK